MAECVLAIKSTAPAPCYHQKQAQDDWFFYRSATIQQKVAVRICFEKRYKDANHNTEAEQVIMDDIKGWN